MKKIALTIAAVASLGLAACSGNQGGTENNTSEANTAETTNEATADTNAASADANAVTAAENALDQAGNAVENASEAVSNVAENTTTNAQ